MPQVHSVGVQADPHERFCGEHLRQQARRVHDDGDDDHGDHGGEQDAAAVHERRRTLDARHHGHQAYKRDAAHGVERQPHVAVQVDLVVRAKLVRWPYESKPCADEQAERAGIGSVVHAGGVGVGVE